MKEFTVKEASTLKNFTDNYCAEASFCFRTLLKNREIRVNGQKVSSSVPLKAGDRVQYYLTPAQKRKHGYCVIYEDEFVAVTDKESGVNTEAVSASLNAAGDYRMIHRLDRNTAGLTIFAKTAEAEEELLCAFRERRVQKVYLARVLGKMPRRHSVEEAYLVKDAASATVRVSNQPQGEKIVTEYRVLREEGETSLLEICLHTGKTHQIRAHMSFLGHPVAGDCKYGNDEYNRAHHLTRQLLVAKTLRIAGQGALAYLGGMEFVSRKNI